MAVFCLDAQAACDFIQLLFLHSGEGSVTFYRTLDEIRLQSRFRVPDRIVIRKADCTEGDEMEQVFSWPKEVQKRVVFAVADEKEGRQISYRGQQFPMLPLKDAICLD